MPQSRWRGCNGAFSSACVFLRHGLSQPLLKPIIGTTCTRKIRRTYSSVSRVEMSVRMDEPRFGAALSFAAAAEAGGFLDPSSSSDRILSNPDSTDATACCKNPHLEAGFVDFCEVAMLV